MTFFVDVLLVHIHVEKSHPRSARELCSSRASRVAGRREEFLRLPRAAGRREEFGPRRDCVQCSVSSRGLVCQLKLMQSNRVTAARAGIIQNSSQPLPPPSKNDSRLT